MLIFFPLKSKKKKKNFTFPGMGLKCVIYTQLVFYPYLFIQNNDNTHLFLGNLIMKLSLLRNDIIITIKMFSFIVKLCKTAQGTF